MAGDRVLTVRIAGDSKGAVGAIGQVQGATVGLGKKLLKVGSLFAGLNFGANMIGDMVAVGRSYTKTMNTLQAASGATDAQMEKIRTTARQLGADLTLPATSAVDATDAMFELYKGGLSVKEAMDAAKGSIQLSTAAQVSNAEAAKIQANTLSQFSLGAEHATRVADILANVANSATGEITDVANALSYVGPVASAMGESVDNTATALGLLAKNSIISNKAGTALRASIASMAKPTDTAKAGLEKLNIAAFDAKGNFKGLEYVTGRLAEAKQNLSQKEFQAAAAAAFGREPLAAINALAKEGVSGWDEMAKAVGREGSAAETAAAKNKGFGGALDALQGQMEDLYLNIYEKLAPGLEEATLFVAEGVQGINEAFEGGFDLSALNDLDGNALGEKIVSAISTALNKLGELSSKLFNKMREVFGQVDWVGLGIELGKAVVPMLLGLALGILNFDLGALLEGLANNWQEVLLGILTIAFAPAKWVAKLAGLLRKIPFVGKMAAWLITGINKIGQKFLKGIGKFFKTFVAGFKKGMGWGGPNMVARLVQFFLNLRAKIITWGKNLAGNLALRAREMMFRFGNWIARHGPRQAYNALVKVKNKVVGFFRGAGSWLWDAGKRIISGLLGGIDSLIGKVTGKLSWLTSKIPDWKGPAERDAVLLKPAGEKIMHGLMAGLESKFGNVRSMLGGFTSDIESEAAKSVRIRASAGPLSASQTYGGRSYAGAPFRGSQGGTTIVVRVDVQGNVIGEKDFARRVTPTVRDELAKIGNRNGGNIFE